MSVQEFAVPPLLLPPRMRGMRGDLEDSAPPLVELTANIAELDGVEIVEASDDGQCVAAYVRACAESDGRRGAPMLLCRIDREVIEIHGLNPRDRHHLLSRRWGRLHGTSVQLFKPRNEHELEACCFVLRRAYVGLMDALAKPAAARARNYWAFDLPKFSRTSLQ